MKTDIYQIDAFSAEVFSGNPAAVCPLEQWMDEDIMQNIARENNLAETAFFVRDESDYKIRWFTPTTEVDLCGHATLASAYVIFNYIEPSINNIAFTSASGPLFVKRTDDLIVLDFPAIPAQKCDCPDILGKALGAEPREVLCCTNYLVVFDSEKQIREIQPDFNMLMKLNLQGVIITAPGDKADFVSRYFAPKYGIPEDPVTGSAHSTLTPYWAQKLNKNKLAAKQISSRGGNLFCENLGERVQIGGHAAEYLRGTINI